MFQGNASKILHPGTSPTGSLLIESNVGERTPPASPSIEPILAVTALRSGRSRSKPRPLPPISAEQLELENLMKKQKAKAEKRRSVLMEKEV